MAMGRCVRVFHSPGSTPYTVLIEQRGFQESLLLESQAILSIGPQESESVKKNLVKLGDAYAILGNLRLSTGDGVLHYLCLVTGCVSVGKLAGSEVYRVTDVKMVGLRGYSPDEEKVQEVKKLLMSGSGYFAWAAGQEQPIDLTLCAQRAHKYAEPDNRFLWNRMLHLPYIRAGIETSAWLCKIMFGSIEIRTVYVGAKQAKAAVISRLSNERAGTRFSCRGVDDDGHVANFVETEQLIQMDESTTSFLQIRGSVPLFWEQPGVNVGSHKIKMSRGPELSAPAFESHLEQTRRRYGHQILVNLLGSSLVGSKEGEATLSTAFQTHHKASTKHSDIPHILFDYHAEGGSKKLDKLDSKVTKYVEKLDCFYGTGTTAHKLQSGVVRTNCADCLDRTNAVQMFIGLKMLSLQLRLIGLDDKENIVSRFEDAFKNMWVSNGNALSKIYAGTGALNQGGSKLLDGARSAARTIQNNLLDKDKQEAFDLLLCGTGRNTDFADRAKLLLPQKYFQAPVPLLQSAVKRWQDFITYQPVRVAVGTYNINGGKHFRSIVYKDVSLDDWLLDAHKQASLIIDTDGEEPPVDIYAIGFEEMVDLDAKNIVNASKENGKEWAVELAKTLNSRKEKYCLLTFHQLVGVCLYIFVRPHLAPYIREVYVDDVKTGMGGATGNKGAVAISFSLQAASFCFLCSHFAAGQSQIAERNNDYSEAVKRVVFPNGRTVLTHDFVFWCGDFNYRINMSRDEVKAAVEEGNIVELLAADQLRIEQAAENVFQGFQEGDITFPPTYKYDLFSDDYDTSEKSRVPAWTDRVLWRARKPQGITGTWFPGTIRHYGRAELKQSDHRPVIAILDLQVRVVDDERRAAVLDEVVADLGPSDGTVVATPLTGPSTLKLTEDVIGAVTSAMSEFGDVRYSREVRGTVWTQFREGGAAQAAINARVIAAGSLDWQVTAPCPAWREMLKQELQLVDNPDLPLVDLNGAPSAFKKESAKLMSQLSRLSFEELEGMTLSSEVTTVTQPAKPPPPRPSAPPSRPMAPPPRPAPPPPRPDPPQQLAKAAEVPKAKPAGFSDLFCAPPDPDIATDIPISLSSGSLVTASGEATPAPTRPPLPVAGSLDYPDDYDPLAESANCWISGTDQVIPGQSPATSPHSPSPPPPPLRPRSPSSSSSSSEEGAADKSSGRSTPTNSEDVTVAGSRSQPARPLPPLPSRPPGGPPPGLPPPAGPPPLAPQPIGRPPVGPPPALPGRPAAGRLPPPVPRR